MSRSATRKPAGKTAGKRRAKSARSRKPTRSATVDPVKTIAHAPPSRSGVMAAGGLKYALRTNQPGSWATDHRKEAEHVTDWVYIAIRATALQAMQASVAVFQDAGPNGVQLKAHRQAERSRWRNSDMLRLGGRQYWDSLKSLYGQEQSATKPLPMDTRICRLMRQPNPSQSGALFRYEQVLQLQSTGQCLVWNVPNSQGVTVERYVIPTAVAYPVPPGADLPRGGFRVDPGAARFHALVDEQGFVEMTGYHSCIGRVIPQEQCQIIRWPHPVVKEDALSPLAAGAKFVDLADQVNTARWSQMVNGFEPSLVILLPDDATPSEDELQSACEKVQQKWGGAANHRKVLMTQAKNVVTPMTSPKDMDYSAGFKESRDAILALLGTPPVAVGIQEAGAYAAYFASLKQHVMGTCQPIFDVLGEEDSRWFSMLRPSPIEPHALIREYPEGTTVEIEAAPITNPEVVERELQTDIAAGAIDVDEIRALRGRKPWGGTKGRAIAGQQQSLSLRTRDTQEVNDPTKPGLSQSPAISALQSLGQANNSSQQQTSPQSSGPSFTPQQATAVSNLVASVVAGEIPRDSGIGQLVTMFGLTAHQAETVMGSAGTSTPTTPNPEPEEPSDNGNDNGNGHVRFPFPKRGSHSLANRMSRPSSSDRCPGDLKDCGTGAGGFKPGNTCAQEDGSGSEDIDEADDE